MDKGIAGGTKRLTMGILALFSASWAGAALGQVGGSVPDFDTLIQVSGLAPADPQPSDDTVAPGLAVTYYYQKFYTLSEVRQPEVAGVQGEPILQLDHDSETDNVLTAEYPVLVGAVINGFIKFPEPGTYGFKVISNDGVWVGIGGEEIWNDPEVHYHRESAPIEITIDEAGWYDLAIDYYQKKGSAALQLFWTPPGKPEQIVPAEAFGHLK